jgi:hypothetical protein
VTGIEQPNVEALQLVGEGADAALHVRFGQVGAVDHVGQGRGLGGDIGRIVARVLQARGVLIGGIADDEATRFSAAAVPGSE